MGNSVAIECKGCQHTRDQDIVERIPESLRRPNEFIPRAQEYMLAFLFGLRKDSGSQLLCNLLNDDIAKIIGKHLLLDAGWMQLSTWDLDSFLCPGTSSASSDDALRMEMARLVYFPNSFDEDDEKVLPLTARRIEKQNEKHSLCGLFRPLPIVAWEVRMYMHSLFQGWVPCDIFKTQRTFVQLSVPLRTLGDDEDDYSTCCCCSSQHCATRRNNNSNSEQEDEDEEEEPVEFFARDTHFVSWMPPLGPGEDTASEFSSVLVSRHADDILSHLKWTFQNCKKDKAATMRQWIAELFLLQMMVFPICDEDSLTAINLQETFIQNQNREFDARCKTIELPTCYGYDDAPTERHSSPYYVEVMVKRDKRTFSLSCDMSDPIDMSGCWCSFCKEILRQENERIMAQYPGSTTAATRA